MENKNNNSTFNYSDMMKNFNPELFMNIFKNMPKINFGNYKDNIQKNAEVIAKANELVAENIQSILKRSAEALKQNFSDSYQGVQAMMSSEGLERATDIHNDNIKRAVENSMNNAKEMMDISTQTMQQLVAIYHDHFMSCMLSTNNK